MNQYRGKATVDYSSGKNITIAKQLLCDNFRPEVASDVISGVDVEQVGMNVHVKTCKIW